MIAVSLLVLLAIFFATAFFSVAMVNVGAGARITASVDTGSQTLPFAPAICHTVPATGACIDATELRASTTVQIDAGQTSTFLVFVVGVGMVPFDPGVNRVFVRFRTAGGAIVGATSVAVMAR